MRTSTRGARSAATRTSDPATANSPSGATRHGAPPLAALILSGLVAVAWGVLLTGAVAPLLLEDPGPVVRWGLPVATVLATFAACATVGLLGMAAFLVPERARTDRRGTATRLAARAALAWAVLQCALVVLTFADLAGLPLGSGDLLSQLVTFVWTLENTRVLLISAVLAVVVATGAALARSRATMAWLAVISVTAVIIQALTGHAAGSASHEDAVNALGLHLIGIVVWTGGLLALALLWQQLGRDLAVTVSRYSVLAAWSFGAVALSGLQQSWIRVGSLAGLGTAYGTVVVLKAVALVALGVLGWRHRRNLAGALATNPADGRLFARLAVGELAVMGAATGLGVALARSAPPVSDAAPNPTRILELTGYPDPGPPAMIDWLTAWRVEWLFLAVAIVAIALYAVGVRRLHRRGDAWPALRTVAWVAGWLLWIYSTCGAPGIWGRVLFSSHMIMHMVVAMIVPLLLVPGAPVTLLLRALPARHDKTWGPRELVLQIVHSRAMKVLANPVVAACLFFFSLAAFYWSPLFEIALTTHTGHLLMMGHFLLTGYLFVWVLIGIDPGVPRWNPLMLLVILFATISFHAFFGVALTDSTDLLAADFFTQLNLPWGPSPLEDQHTAGEIAWGVGEVPTLILAVVVAFQWARRDKQETVRLDRQADRDDDAELKAYNDFLAGLRREVEEDPETPATHSPPR